MTGTDRGRLPLAMNAGTRTQHPTCQTCRASSWLTQARSLPKMVTGGSTDQVFSREERVSYISEIKSCSEQRWWRHWRRRDTNAIGSGNSGCGNGSASGLLRSQVKQARQRHPKQAQKGLGRDSSNCDGDNDGNSGSSRGGSSGNGSGRSSGSSSSKDSAS